MATQVILLERIEKLGAMGDVVNVKPGYARNYLLPQSKALRATKDNIAYFETQKDALEKANAERKKDAEKRAKALDKLTVSIIRQASETGHLYGSVAARDIAEAVNEATKETLTRGMVALNQNLKTIGIFPVDIALHPEVKVEITINIARSEDEAKIQAKTGKAVIADEQAEIEAENAAKAEEEAKARMLEDSALEAEKEKTEESAVKEAAEAEKAQKKAAKKAAKAEARAEEDSEEAPQPEEASESEDAKAE
ncbi:MAG: 50S ribosomal protein L9 [Rhodospirillales bacterium]|nr:50S ribosomal protein L9 [Alphaproteobacteria bacterium]USO04415.1 MAG: 50S ribosomal protein L9 [Rhodospirillales bacterium]